MHVAEKPPPHRDSLRLPPSRGPEPSTARGGTSCELWPLAWGSRRGTNTLCFDSAVSKTGGSNWKIFDVQIEPGVVLEMGIDGGSRDATSRAERALPHILLLMRRGCRTSDPPPWCPAAGEGAKALG